MKINRGLWNVVITVLVLFMQIAPASQAMNQFPEARAADTLSTKVHIFYYPWYGLDPYRHWEQGGHTPPNGIGSDFYPVLGPYDSGDFAGAVTTHMQQIQQAGVGVIVLSWWGPGSYEDDQTAGIMDKANLYGIKVAFHIEPYVGRTASSVVGDVNYINNRYGSHPAYYRDAEHGNRPAFYVFETYRIADWSPIAPLKANNIILQQTAEEFTQTPNFGGLYTYDGIAGTFAPGWAVASAYAQAHDMVWAPSVAPGYLDDRAVPGNITPTIDRKNGISYDEEWQNVLNPANGQPTWISITSFNEWHEGSQIEPARNTPPAGYGYLTYQNAYGLTGSAAQSAYLTRTRHWVDIFDPQGSTLPQAPGRLIATAGNGQIGLTWEAASSATSYNVKRSAVSGDAYTTISNVTGTSFTDTNLTNGTPYYYAVWAVNGSGESILATNEASAVPFSGTNLVLNPGFETGSAANAANWTEGTQHTRIGTSKNGSWSLISNYSGTDSAQTVSSAIAVSQNTTYTLSGWIYVFKGASPGRACIDLNGISGSPQLCTTTTMAELSRWKYLSGTWNSGSNTSVTVRLLTDQTPYTTWFDDIRLSVEDGSTPPPTTPPPSGNLVLNSGFEAQGSSAADAANWTEGANHTRASDKFHTGGWSLHSTYRGTGTDTRTTAPIAVSANTDYTYSGYVWRTNATGGACMDMADLVGERQLCASATGNWQLLTGTWNSGSNTSVNLRLITDGSPTGDIWFDDISLAGGDGPTVTPTNTTTPPTATHTPTSTPTPTASQTNTPPSGGNLVLNPGFETQGNTVADAANWAEGTNHARASDKFHTGGWSLHSTYRGAGTDTRTMAAIPVSANTTYTYSGYIWRTNATGAACMDMADIIGERQLCASATGNWQFLTGTWNSGSNTSVGLRLITDGSPTGDIWFDDISLIGSDGPTLTPTKTSTPTRTPTVSPTPTITNTAPPSGNLVLNPGFEAQGNTAADAANWTEGANHTRASDKFHTGSWSLRSTYRGTGTATQTTAAISVSPNTTYTYSGYIWRTNSTGGACMDMADIVGERQLCTAASGNWQFLTGTWNSGSNTSVRLRLITDGSPTGDIWFDDISLVGGTPVTDAPQLIHLSWTDNNGAVDPSTTMNVTWSTTQTGDSIVRYGSSLSYGSQATGTTAYSTSLGVYMHSTKLTGLVPNQVYHYSVGSTTLGYSSDFTFKTAPAKGTIGLYTIGLWSDTQNVGSNSTFGITSGIVTKMIPYAPLFTLHIGDIVESGSSAQSMKDFLAVSQGLNATAPLMPVLGNHDLRNAAGSTFQAPYANFTDGFNLPGNELYYSFNYGNAHFTAIDTGVANVATVDQMLFKPGSAQYDWLVNDLNAANNDPDIKWKIVYMHFPPYATGVSLVQYVQDILAPLMDTYHVDLVITGHRHVYERSMSIYDKAAVQPGPNYTDTPEGTVYVVAGTAGGAPMGAGESWFTARSWVGYDFAILNINGNVLTYTMKSSADSNIDTFTITK